MKYNTNVDGGTVTGDVSIGQLTVTGFVTLIRSPVDALEAATKDYIDIKAEAISASRIYSGVFAKARFPGFTGEVTANANTGVFSLPINGITPGWFSKVTPETRGFVASGGTLSSTDIPALTWNKVRVDAPTTLSGYGITNVVGRENSTITGTLTLSANPSENDDSVTKMYVDTRDSSRATARTGDLLLTHRTDAIAGYLRANGGEADSRTYGDLFNLIGYKYTKRLPKSTGAPWANQYYFNHETNTLGSNITWTREADILSPGIGFPMLASTGKFVYTFGGLNGVYASNYVRRAPINADGTIGTWVSMVDSPLAYSLYASSIFIHNDNLYVVAGTVNGSHGNATVIHWAAINSDGTIGAWKTHQNSYFSGFGQIPHVIDGRLYLIFTDSYAWTEFAADGSLPGPWYAGSNSPYNIGYNTTFVIRDYIYAIVYRDSTNVVIRAKFLPSGGLSTWEDVTGPAGTFPFRAGKSPVIVTNKAVYILGGDSSGNYTPTRQLAVAEISANGALSGWITTIGGVPIESNWNQAFVTNSKLYLIGGYVGSAQGQVWSTPFNGGSSDYIPHQKLQPHQLSDINNFSLPDYSSPATNYINAVATLIDYQSNHTNVQYDFNNAPNTLPTTTLPSSTYPTTIIRSHVITTKNFVYSIAGEVGTNNIVSTIYRAPINADGTIGAWVSMGAFPSTLAGGAVAQYKNRIYILGGGTVSAANVATVYTALINPDGTIGTWSTSRALPESRNNGSALVLGNKLYFFGGIYGTSNNLSATQIYVSTISEDGSLGAWSTFSTAFPVALGENKSFIAGDFVYVSSYNSNNIYRADISKSDPTTFGTFSITLPGDNIHNRAYFVTKNGIYSFKAKDQENISVLRVHPFTENGDIGQAVESTVGFGYGCGGGKLFATSSRLYVIGGYSPVYLNKIEVIDKPGGLNDYSDLYFGRFIKERSTKAETARFSDVNKPNIYIKY